MVNSVKPADPSLLRFALHGGAGDVSDNSGEQLEQQDALRQIAHESFSRLKDGATSLDTVIHAVGLLEECPLFNAGIGAVLNRNGIPELDAALMRGSDRACGAVTCVSRVRSPIQFAHAIMVRTPHVLFSGAGAEELARELGLDLVDPSYFITQDRISQLEKARRAGVIVLDHDDALPPVDSAAFGTVGAVARDMYGHLAAATSTGGLTNKLPGRIGDTPLLGIGTFADDHSCAISCTGTGEAFIRAGFASAIHARVAWNGWSLERACNASLETVRQYGGRGGCIAIGADGSMHLPFNSKAMFRASVDADGTIRTAFRNDEGRA